MGIGNKLSKLLEANGTNANELANKINVPPQTIYSIIKRDSKKADIEVLLKIAETFGVTAEYFVYDTPSFPPKSSTEYSSRLSTSEIEHIKKYRGLDNHGKEMVDIVLDKEWGRSTARVSPFPLSPLLDAAHKRTDIETTEEMCTHDDDIMDDENF